MEKIEVELATDGCWLWRGAIQRSNGYGRFALNPPTVIYAHRASFLIFNGDIPAGMSVCHTCDVTRCVNPKHLFIGDQFDNMQDAARKGRTSRGEKHSRSIRRRRRRLR